MKSALVRTITIALAMLSVPALAGAYSINGPAPTSSADMPWTIPSDTFNLGNLNWTNFLNTLPIEGFVASLQSAGQGIATGNSLPTGLGMPPAGISEAGQSILQSLDAWSAAHLGFRLSGIIFVILGIFSWALNLAKAAADWLIRFLK